ncbi:MAG: glycosyltransferase [Chloroflexota bacterium]|nr:glycosyltransferase [Chloroflexota bacterium]
MSSTTYWLARGLAERGHQIDMVTNADEVEPAYRMLLEPDDWPHYQPEFPASGGRVRVYNTEPFTPRTMDHVPQGNPFVSKLAGLGTGVVRAHDSQAIFAYYYEPYAVAAAQVAHWTGRPLVLKHAGSDLDRLFRVPDLASAYKEILRSADMVVTQRPLMGRFLGMGVHQERLSADVRFAIPHQFFGQEVPPLDIDRLTVRPIHDPNSGIVVSPPVYDSHLPAVGIYGKTGISKGTYDLIAALGSLASDRLAFNFVAMIGAVQGRRLIAAISDAGLVERTYILPFVPNWKVARFIRACTAICFLERDFPVAIHGPVVPREVLTAGTCLVLSGEIAAKQVDAGEYTTGTNVMIVDDPKDRAQLADRLRMVVTDPLRAVEIGKNGQRLPQAGEDHAEFISGWEKIFGRLLEEDRRGRRRPQRWVTATDRLSRFAPRLRAILERTQAARIAEFARASGQTDAVEAGLALCALLLQHLEDDLPTPLGAKLRDALRYQHARIESTHDRGDSAQGFAVLDQVQDGRAINEQSVSHLRPVRGSWIQIVAFDFDVTPVFAEATAPVDAADDQLEDIAPDEMLVLFQRTANLAPKELRVNAATRDLLAGCDGSRTTAEVITAICKQFGDESPDARQHVMAALEALYRHNVIVFGEQRPGWGWTGGVRWTVDDLPMARDGRFFAPRASVLS